MKFLCKVFGCIYPEISSFHGSVLDEEGAYIKPNPYNKRNRRVTHYFRREYNFLGYLVKTQRKPFKTGYFNRRNDIKNFNKDMKTCIRCSKLYKEPAGE